MNLEIRNVHPDDYVLAVQAARLFTARHTKPMFGIRYGELIGYPSEDGNIKLFYVYQTKIKIVVKWSSEND